MSETLSIKPKKERLVDNIQGLSHRAKYELRDVSDLVLKLVIKSIIDKGEKVHESCFVDLCLKTQKHYEEFIETRKAI